jgi:hypothetical protein
LTDPLKSRTGSAAALCDALHKDPVTSFKPSTVINQTATRTLVQVEVTTQAEGDKFDIVTVENDLISLIEISA